ncbi:flagellar biosynthesis protein FlhB [Tumebacillus sp. ITR2]|uniref:Flagellar biosynthetic protein FlhB n=1 Tax=Tumebacillus amylolyticus TaxID=2801339 RepID=A0ABS1JF61_9BACL|nr:flagellar biosynthesis protein FlhB [Tumebacillus amylolyticus]MBL0388927.1 flagellar biosynthesis protein FlhB [Tumebacillus amylolyticus]
MIRLNLQFFSGEKTEKPTSKKRGDARKKGQVARSQEFGQAAVLLSGLFTLKLLSGYYIDQLTHMFQLNLTTGLYTQITDQSVIPLFLQMLLLLAKLILPIAGVVMVIGAFTSYLQVGTLFTLKPLMPDFNKINPIEGFKRIFSARTFVELLKSILKMAVIGFIVYSELMGDWQRVSQLGDMGVVDMLTVVSSLVYGIFWKVGFAMLALAVADLLYQRFDFERGLKMSKQEIKEEYKQQEGSPEVKGKIKERQRAMAMRRMMADVPKADVVITNPTHFAIALKYDPNNMESPQVIAKGVDETAQRIKKVARDNNVICVENRPLAQTLYRTVEIGDAVPGELFQAVAEVLAYVYRLKGKV